MFLSIKSKFLWLMTILLLLLIFIPLKWLINDNIPVWSIWIIYWNKVNLDWSISDRLKARLDAGIKLFNNWTLDKIIVSWWIWKEWYDEAIVMKEYLFNNWVSLDYILVDSKWYTTQKTSNNALNLISLNSNVVWISQFYHISRVKLSLWNVWFSNVYWYSPKYFEYRDLYSSIREIPAYFKYLFTQ